MVDLGHGRGWLNADAAVSLWRVDAQIGHPLQITDAGRTWAEQAHLRWLYENGQGSFAAKPGESPHEAGNAIDTNERLVDILHDHGWRRPLAFEPWHFVYWPNLDNHRNAPASTGKSVVRPIIPELLEDDMKLLFVTDSVDGNDVPGWVLLNTRTGKLITLRTDVEGAQENANSWARVWGTAKKCTRQDMLNAQAAITGTC